jgi:hypothetical protein
MSIYNYKPIQILTFMHFSQYCARELCYLNPDFDHNLRFSIVNRRDFYFASRSGRAKLKKMFIFLDIFNMNIPGVPKKTCEL